jgi:hypothetical protein
MTPFDLFQGKTLRCESRSLELKAKAYCKADPSILGYVDREGITAIRRKSQAEIFVVTKENPKTVLFKRRVFMAGALVLGEPGQDAPSEATDSLSGEA